ncbi:hypothetical protein LX36DRAFT_564496 [Colletotrichum falcatum]|nr:hypothetical protein LX36DRAFT_564496 [Colletotrichum falcatum]
MAPGQKAYPRGTVKKIIKAHSNCNLSKNVDVMIYLDYVLFMQTLVKEAAIESKKSGERGITARSVKKVTSVCILARAQASIFDARRLTCLAGYSDQVQGLNTEPSDERRNNVRNMLPRYLVPVSSVPRTCKPAHRVSTTEIVGLSRRVCRGWRLFEVRRGRLRRITRHNQDGVWQWVRPKPRKTLVPCWNREKHGVNGQDSG